MKPANPASPTTPRPSRKLRWTLGILLSLLAAVYFLGPTLLAPILQRRLQAMVSEHLNANLTMERLSYDFPYGLRAKNAALVTRDSNGQNVDLLRVGQLDLALAQLPFGDGPLVIEKIIVNNPSAHLILTEHGFIGGRGLVKDQPAESKPAQPGQPPKPAKEKPSDYFRLRRFEINSGQIAFEDRRRTEPLPQAIWKNLAVELNINPASGSLYTYEFSARNAPLALASVRGKFDIDALLLDVERFVLALQVEREKKQEQLPPRWQEILANYGVAGKLSISGSARIPFKESESATYQAVLDLPGASARLSGSNQRLDRLALKIRFASENKDAASTEVARPVTASDSAASATQPTTRFVESATGKTNQPPVRVNLEMLDIASGDTQLHAEKADATIDPSSGLWRVNELLCRLEIGKDRSGLPSSIEKALSKFELGGKIKLTATAAGPLQPIPGLRIADQIEYQIVAYPRDISVKPHNWPKPFTGLSGTLHANAKAIDIENVEATYQADRFYLTKARIPMNNIENELKIVEMSGSVELSGQADYPKPFDFVSNEIRPAGTWYALGNFTRKHGPGVKPEFKFDVRSDGAAATLTKDRIPVTDIKSEISINHRLIELKRVEAQSLGGKINADGQITIGKGKDMLYTGSAWGRDLDLKTLGVLTAQDPKRPTRLSGKGNINIKFDGAGHDQNQTAAQSFHAAGKFEVLEGDFWEIPILSEIVGNTKTARSALTAGQATGAFQIHDQKIELKDVAISAPVLGVQGGGVIGFDKKVDMRVVAAPLADWKDNIKRTKIPLLSDIAGEVFGGLQKMINTASKTLLYEFRISGTTANPKVETIPAPVLTDSVAAIFSKMLKGEKVGEPVNK